MKNIRVLVLLSILVFSFLTVQHLNARDTSSAIERGDLQKNEKVPGFYARIRNPKFNIDDIIKSAELDLKSRNFFYNGAVKKGKLRDGKSAYITLSFYKANKYVLSLGADYNINGLKIELFNASTHDLIFANEVPRNSYKSLIIRPKVNGNYYLKITSQTDNPAGGEWMFLYGFNDNK